MKVTRHRLQIQFTLAALPMSLTHPSGVFVEQVADQELAQMDRMTGLVPGLQAHCLSHKCPADKTQAPPPFDMTAIADPSYFPRGGINQRRQHVGISPAAGTIDLRGRALTQGFVRTLLVVIRQPSARTSLHRLTVRRALGHDFLLVTTMKLFVRRVVARSRPAGELDPNAQPQPPHRQARETQRPFAAKRRTVVHANCFGHSPFLKQASHHATHRPIVLIGQQSQAQAITTQQIAHRQGFLANAILSAEPALEIHCPYLVGPTGYGQSWMGHRRTASGAFGPRPHPSSVFEPALNGAHTGRAATRILPSQLLMNLLAAPMGSSTAHPLNRLEPEDGQSVGRTTRLSRLILQTLQAALTVSVQPFVSGLAADAEPDREHLDGLMTRQHGFGQTLTHFEQGNGFPRHDRRKRRKLLKNCHPCPVPSVSPMSCHRARRVYSPNLERANCL